MILNQKNWIRNRERKFEPGSCAQIQKIGPGPARNNFSEVEQDPESQYWTWNPNYKPRDMKKVLDLTPELRQLGTETCCFFYGKSINN